MITGKSLYLLLNLVTIAIPFIFSFHPRLQFHRHFKPFIMANLIVAAFFILWDSIFTKMGVWGFNPDYVTGLSLFNLPLEEILFFICIPFACVFTYHCLSLFWKMNWSQRTEDAVVFLLVIFMLLTGVFNYEKLYTSVTFITTAMTLIVIRLVFKVSWLPQLITVYLVLLIPFFIINGILTGTGIPEAVVWYNNSENLDIRIGTIPLEDIFYGFLLFMMNVFLYEVLKRQSAPYSYFTIHDNISKSVSEESATTNSSTLKSDIINP